MTSIRNRALALAGLLSCTALSAEVPAEKLAKPPRSAQHYTISSTGGRHGESWIWRTPDGKLMGRETLNLRGQKWEEDATERSGPDGMPRSLDIRGFSPTGDAAETFAIAGAQATWKSQVDSGAAPYTASRFYLSQGGPISTTVSFLERLLAAPDRTMKVLPAGEARAEQLTTLEIGAGSTKKTVTAWAIKGLTPSPIAMWSDANGKFFGLVGFLAWLPDTYEGERAKLEAAQDAALSALMPALAKSLVTVPATPVAFTHVQLYDADKSAFLADRTVVVTDGKITAVGPAKKVRVPKNAQVIDGTGKTLVPGLWDCHMHVGDDYTGIQELSLGVTSVRDPGNNDVKTVDRRTRAAKGELLMPNVYASSLIDGKGPNTAQVANVAESQDQAIDLVRKAKATGFIGVKFYGTFKPEWLPATIAEAHKLGLHVHGHIPQGIRPSVAIEDGYDEITHINWVMMQAMPDSVIAVDSGIARFEGPGRYAKDVDLNGPAISGIVTTMAQRKIAIDPTAVTFESLYVPNNGEVTGAYTPFLGTLPATTERGMKTGGFAVPKDLTRADYRASFAKMLALVKKLHDAGVPIVAGTDGSGIELVRELELYVEAGMTPAQALATATIAPARLVGADKTTGSIVVGKTADLALIYGDPAKSIGALRQTRVVMMGNRMMDADALRTAAGYSGRPH